MTKNLVLLMVTLFTLGANAHAMISSTDIAKLTFKEALREKDINASNLHVLETWNSIMAMDQFAQNNDLPKYYIRRYNVTFNLLNVLVSCHGQITDDNSSSRSSVVLRDCTVKSQGLENGVLVSQDR